MLVAATALDGQQQQQHATGHARRRSGYGDRGALRMAYSQPNSPLLHAAGRETTGVGQTRTAQNSPAKKLSRLVGRISLSLVLAFRLFSSVYFATLNFTHSWLINDPPCSTMRGRRARHRTQPSTTPTAHYSGIFAPSVPVRPQLLLPTTPTKLSPLGLAALSPGHGIAATSHALFTSPLPAPAQPSPQPPPPQQQQPPQAGRVRWRCGELAACIDAADGQRATRSRIEIQAFAAAYRQLMLQEQQ